MKKITIFFGLLTGLLFFSCSLEKIDDPIGSGQCPNPPGAVFQADVSTGNAPLTVKFTDSSTGAVSYEWNFGDGSAKVTVKAPQHIFTATGTFTVTLIATSSDGCKDTATTLITTGKNTFLKIVDIGIPYDENSNPAYEYYRYVTDFVSGNIRIVMPKPNPGKIEIFRFDSTGSSPNGYPLISNQFELNDSFYLGILKNGNSIFLRKEFFNNSESVYDSCFSNSLGTKKDFFFNGSQLYKIDENDIITSKYLEFPGLPPNTESAWGIYDLSALKNGDIGLINHIGYYYYNSNESRTILDRTDIVLSRYSSNLVYQGSETLNYYRGDLVWNLQEFNNFFILYGMGQFQPESCIGWGGVELKYLNKSDYSSITIKKDDDPTITEYEKDGQSLRTIDASTKALFGNDGDQSYTRLKLTLFNSATETKISGFPIYIPPPNGYSNIDWGNLVKKDNIFHIIAKIKTNPNASSNDVCLIKVSNTGQILDTDIYSAAEGMPPGLKEDVNLYPMSDGGFLIYAFVPSTGKLAILRVDKDGNL